MLSGMVSHFNRSKQVCKKMYAITRMRPLWVSLARTQIISRGLPWPAYAHTFTSIPTETIEQLAVRAILMRDHWDHGKARGNCEPVGCITCPRGSVSWLHIIRSKWLVVGIKSGVLELWDMENHDDARATSSFGGMIGFVCSGLTASDATGNLILIVSTRYATLGILNSVLMLSTFKHEPHLLL